MQRLHDDDLSGFLKKSSSDWDVLDLAAIGLRDEQIPIGDERFHHRQIGDVLHPERESKSDLDKIRAVFGEEIFAAQYQQCPLLPMGVMIKREWIQRYEYLPIRTKSHYLIQSWDTAIKAGEQHDYSAGVSVLLDERGNYCIIDSCRDRLLYHQLKACILSEARKHKPDVVLIEEAGLGRTLVSELKASGLNVVGVIPEGDKPTRLSLQLEKFEQGRVFFPAEASWLPELENEVLAAPNGRHDDQLDALIQALAYTRPTGWSDASLNGLRTLINGLW